MQTKDIFIVTNDTYVTDKCLYNLYEAKDMNAVSSSPILDEWTTSYDSCWQDIVNGEPVEKGCMRSHGQNYNIYRVPLAGLIYTTAYTRKQNETDRRIMILSVKEANQTPLVTLEKYHVLFDTRFIPPITFFRRWFEDAESNSLLSSDYDFLLEMADKGIAGLSKYYKNIVGNEG